MVNFLFHGWMNSVEREELWLLLSQLLLVLIKICVFVRFSRRKETASVNECRLPGDCTGGRKRG